MSDPVYIRQHSLALIVSWVAPFVSLGMLIVRIIEPGISMNKVVSNMLAVAGISYLSYFIHCLSNCKEAAFFAARIPADDPDGQRESVWLLAMVIVNASLCLQYFVLQ